MTRRVLFNPSLPPAPNVGNRIIIESVEREIRALLPGPPPVHVPVARLPDPGTRALLREAHLVFLGGACHLTSHQWLFRPWRDVAAMAGKVVVMGTGWWRYESNPDLWTRRFYRKLFNPDVVHAVRDDYAGAKLRSIGVRAVNTGCPSLWTLTPEHCKRIPTEKSDAVLMTLTSYRQDPARDRELFDILNRHYGKLYLGLLQKRDYPYARHILPGGKSFPECVDPALEALDEMLGAAIGLDYVGTRLHAYIRAVQHGRRSINIGVDLRAIEMDRGLFSMLVQRGDWPSLEQTIVGKWQTRLGVPFETISRWKNQFARSAGGPRQGEKPARDNDHCVQGKKLWPRSE